MRFSNSLKQGFDREDHLLRTAQNRSDLEKMRRLDLEQVQKTFLAERNEMKSKLGEIMKEREEYRAKTNDQKSKEKLIIDKLLKEKMTPEDFSFVGSLNRSFESSPLMQRAL